MPDKSEDNLRLEIGHVLFIDLVGYSKLLIEEQRERLNQLTGIVLATAQVAAAPNEQLVRLPTGDGMALVFRNSSEEPAQCALEIARALQEHPKVRVRMGIHSGPVSEVTDVSGRSNIAGPGINLAQRVMDCGDAGHILLSQRVAEDLGNYARWKPHLHDLGECEVKHGVRLHLFSLWSETFGLASLPARLSGQQSAEHSVAVLPFVDLSEAKNQEYLCDGMSEELTHTLAKTPGLRVVARTSAFSFKGKTIAIPEIAKQLGVSHVIEGSLRRSGNRIRVTAQLINARTGFHLWSDTIQREMGDVFELEDEITRAIVDALKVKLASASPLRLSKGNSAANDFYLQGLYLANKSGEDDLRKAAAFFEKAVERDPEFSRAWSSLARVRSHLADAYVRPLDAYPIAQAAAEKALSLEERDPVAHCVLGFSKKVLFWDESAMVSEAKRALEIDPNSALAHVWYGDTFRGSGEFDQAIEKYRTAAMLDPLSAVVSDNLAGGYLIAGRLDDAIAQGKRTFELDPRYAYLDSTLANAYREKGLFDEAIALYEQGERFTRAPSRGLGITYARAGKRDKAEQVLARFLAERETKYISAAAIGLIYAALGKKDEAFRWLEFAYEDHDAVLTTIAFYPGSQPLRNDPRFIDLIARVGLDPAKAIPPEKQP